MSYLRKILGTLLAGMFILTALPLQATYPDAGWGTYTYKSSDLNIKVVWTIEGVTKAVVNGKNYPHATSWEEENRANFGSEGTQPFHFTFEKNEKRRKDLDLLLLFTEGKLIRVAGLYSESIADKANDTGYKVNMSKAFQMTFTPAKSH